MTLHPPTVDRVQTGVRMERRLVKVLKAVAELRDLALGELLEELVRDAFAGRHPFEESALPSIRELMAIYGLPAGAYGAPATPGVPAPGGE
jgi:hypothetical protein